LSRVVGVAELEKEVGIAGVMGEKLGENGDNDRGDRLLRVSICTNEKARVKEDESNRKHKGRGRQLALYLRKLGGVEHTLRTSVVLSSRL
jgi:hypothetical protein